MVYEGAINFRPVGTATGLAAQFYRSGDLAGVQASAATAIYNRLGVRSFIDLRSEAEVIRYGEPVELTRQGVDWVRSPISGYSGEPIRHASASAADYARYYLDLLESSSMALVNSLTVIADRCEEPVVFGCHAGKDRTGLLSIVLLEIAGATRDEIRDDYAASTQALQVSIDNFSDKWQRRGLDRQVYATRLTAHPETIDAFYTLLGGSQLVEILSQRGFAADRRLRLVKALVRHRPSNRRVV